MKKKHPLISIIVPVKNALKTTQVCLDSIIQYTDDFELIIIDDGSGEETIKYLAAFDGYVLDGSEVELIRNNQSQGWCKSINQGIDLCKGEYIVFCNSDTGMTPKWDSDMIECFEDNPKLGLLGPTTNSVSGRQNREKELRSIYCAKYLELVDNLIFFFVMIRKAALDDIGKLDERFGLGGQDDTDYCIRAKKKEWEIGITRNVFIYHYGSASFREEFNHDVGKSIQYAQSRKNILKEKYKRPRVMIGIPNNGEIVTQLAHNLDYWLTCGKYDIYKNQPSGLFPLDNARNTIVKEFLELDYDYLWWIDRDITPPLDALDKLLAADKDIIGAVAFSYREDDGKFFTYPVTLRYNDEKNYVLYYGKGKGEIEEVDATGGACVLYKRKVYEMLERPYEFKYHKDGTLSLTCDFHIFQKCQALGLKLYIDYSIICSHFKIVDLKKVNDQLARLKIEGNEKIEKIDQEWSEKYRELEEKYSLCMIKLLQ